MLLRMSCMEHDFVVRGRGLTSISAGVLEEPASSLAAVAAAAAAGGGGGLGVPGAGLFGTLGDGEEDEEAGAAAAVAAVAAATEAEREAATAGGAGTREVGGKESVQESFCVVKERGRVFSRAGGASCVLEWVSKHC